jgi:hypothetical protein
VDSVQADVVIVADPSDRRYLVPITIAPAFICAAIYLSLSRIVIVHGRHLSRFSPRFYAITFMTCDFISLVLQGAGGGLAATADDQSGSDTGRGIMIAGLVSQLISIMVFMGLWLEFTWRLHNVRDSNKNVQFVELRATRQFKLFTYGKCHGTALAVTHCTDRSIAVWTAIILIFIRSVYRIAELQEGFHGPIANNEVLFMILDGPMIILAVLSLTIIHPGIGFRGQWGAASWSLRSRKADSIGREEIIMTPKSDSRGLLRTIRK